MSEERFAARKAKLGSALKRLQEGVVQPETALVRDAVIQRFEFTFELVWKTLKLYLGRATRLRLWRTALHAEESLHGRPNRIAG